MIFTNIRNLKYVTANNSFIDLLATCNEFGEIPMTLNLVDTEDLHVFATGKFEVVLEDKKEIEKEILIPLEEYCKKQKIAPYVEPEPVVIIPNSITPLQAKLQLLDEELLDEVEVMVKVDRKIELYWTNAQNFYRNDEILLGMATALGLNAAQLDNLFIKASKR